MATQTTVGDLKRAILNLQAAVVDAQQLFAMLDPNASVGSAETTVHFADPATCIRPEKRPEPIHPSTAACYLGFPMKIEYLVEPLQSMNDIAQIMLTGLDAVNPDMPLPRRCG